MTIMAMMLNIIDRSLYWAQRSFAWKLVTCISLLIVADFLFFDQKAGWTLGLFGSLFITSFICHNFKNLNSTIAKVLVLISIGQSLVLVETANTLAFVLFGLGIISLTIVHKSLWHHNAVVWLKSILLFIVSFRKFARDVSAIKRVRHRLSSRGHSNFFLSGWLLPVTLSGVFLLLFTQANPLIMAWFERINFSRIYEFFSFTRLIFWLVLAGLFLMVIRPRLGWTVVKTVEPVAVSMEGNQKDQLFSKEAVLRSLIMFNLMFAVQTGMDITYLWHGRALPEGISFAEYAHKGAYPLIFTALLAGVFVILTQRAGQHVSGSLWVRHLIFLWIGQNILLVFSAIFRNILYVEIYSLTYLRIAAFIWMALVATGLFFIILSMMLRKSEIWLININMLAALIVLNVCSIMDIGGRIAVYNVMQSKEVTGRGNSLDFEYLYELGAVAIPAFDLLLDSKDTALSTRLGAHKYRQKLTRDLTLNMQDWRRWTYREYRLLKAINEDPSAQETRPLKNSGWQVVPDKDN